MSANVGKSGSFIFKGRLCGYICSECPEPLSSVRVRLYRAREGQDITGLAVASPKETFAILSDDDVKAKQSSLIAEAETDEQGNFTFELGNKQKYSGEAFEIDVYCGTVPHRKPGPNPPPPVQFSITTLRPMWRRSELGSIAAWEYCIPYRYWCAVRGRFGAWTICGLLTTCKNKLPIGGATVYAYDADWLQDDPLGSGVTDATGHFRIDYAREDFERTPFSFIGINFECVSGPDVYFSVEYAGAPVFSEDRSAGRQPGRENVGPCMCVELCTDEVPHQNDPEKAPHWTTVDGFNVHASFLDLPHNILPEGYAGLPEASYVFNGTPGLSGNCPLKNVAAPANPLKYRFLIAEWGWGGGDGTAGVMPTVAPPALPSPLETNPAYSFVKVGGASRVGDLYYTGAPNPLLDSTPVYITAADQDAEGWIRLDGLTVVVPQFGGGTVVKHVSDTDPEVSFLRSGLLMGMDSVAVTSKHASRRPAWAGDLTQAGRALTLAEQEPIRRYRMVFQVRDAVTNTDVWTDVLDSIIFNNSSPIVLVNLEELLLNVCNPIMGLANIHVRYTADHPHLRYYSLQISSNAGVAHDAPPAPPAPLPATPPPLDMPRGDFPTPPGYLFRGNASGTSAGTGPVDISADPKCAYRVKLSFQTRNLYDSGSSIEVLYCIE